MAEPERMKNLFLAAEKAVSIWLGIWQDPAGAPSSWSADGSVDPAPTLTASRARTKSGAQRSQIWRVTPANLVR